MKKIAMLFVVLAMSLALAACGCDHVWMAATCDTPKTCEECGETEGDPKGHAMVEATCEEPRHCENCDLTEGEALGHIWLDATTEAPQTCETCGATEGERIITDPRFTTASTIGLHGKWEMEMPINGELMGIPDFPEGAAMYITLEFSNAGDLDVGIDVSDSFNQLLVQYTVDLMYSEFAAQGMDQETVDAMFEEMYGTSIQTYVEQQMENVDYTDMFAMALDAADVGGVYYVEDGQLYSGASWDGELVPEDFTLEGDSLTLGSFTGLFGDVGSFVRVVE